jgi:diguanylate cyclase (GGDEF)-like protein/PAS domain S-box-containing protein
MAKLTSHRCLGQQAVVHSPALALCEVLLVSRSARLFERIAVALGDATDTCYHMTAVANLEGAARTLGEHVFQVLLLDWSLVTQPACPALMALLDATPTVAVLALWHGAEPARATAALALGAQDYVLETDLDGCRLARMMHSAIARKHHEREQAERALRTAMTLDSIGDAVLSTDAQGRVSYLNLVAETMTGWSSAQACGRPLNEVFTILNEVTRQPVPDPLQRAVREDRAVELANDCVLLRRDGHEYLIEDSAAPIRSRDGQVIGAVIVFRDVGALRATTRDMAYLAHHDVLTNLPNRLLFGERVANAIVLARRHLRQAAVLYVDLDGFKCINDTLGHALGDSLLLSVTERLVQSVRASDTVCRQGGDEFVVLLSEIDGADDAAASAGKLLRTLAEPYLLDGHTLHLTASIGIALYPKDGREVVELLHSADGAMYAAKRLGRNQFQFYAMSEAVQGRSG